MVEASSLEAFSRGARALKVAAPGTRLEAGVYADAGDQGLEIAAQRAEAVRLQLAIRGVNPEAIQPRVLPAKDGQAGRVAFRTLPPIDPATVQAKPAADATTAAGGDADAG